MAKDTKNKALQSKLHGDEGIREALSFTRKALGKKDSKTVWESMHGDRPKPSHWGKHKQRTIPDVPRGTPGWDRD